MNIKKIENIFSIRFKILSYSLFSKTVCKNYFRFSLSRLILNKNYVVQNDVPLREAAPDLRASNVSCPFCYTKRMQVRTNIYILQ
jgi:hypothetical protein